MTYIYHGVPEELKGTELIPLSKMLEVDSELRAKYVEKYKGREEILERRIPLLDCTWDEVVQLLPLNPKKIFELQKEIGVIDDIPNYRYFKIETEMLDPDMTVVYFKTAPGDENVTVKWLRDVNIQDLQDVPEATKNYYLDMVGTNSPIFNYQFVPHILYKGTIDVSDANTLHLIDN